MNKHDTADGRDQQFWDSWASWPMGDWRGRVKLGAYTAEFGKCQDGHGLAEVNIFDGDFSVFAALDHQQTISAVRVRTNALQNFVDPSFNRASALYVQ